VSPRTLNRLAVLLAARPPDATLKLKDLDDALAAELSRRIRSARAAGWSNETLAATVEQARDSERHRTPRSGLTHSASTSTATPPTHSSSARAHEPPDGGRAVAATAAGISSARAAVGGDRPPGRALPIANDVV
jgi:hypothetical protein